MTTTSLAISRDYLAHSLATGTIQLSDAQKEAVRSYLTRNVPAKILNPFARVSNRRTIINTALHQCIENRTLLVPGVDKDRNWTSPDDILVEAIYAQVVGLDVLQPLLDDPDITSITVLDHQTILYEKMGQTYESPHIFSSPERVVEVIKNLAIRGGQQLTSQKPTADLAFPPPNVVRIHLTIDPVTPRTGGFCALRRGREQTWTLDTLVSKGMMDDQVADFLRDLMRIPASCIIGGEPSSGKTTLLEVMLNSMPKMHIALLEQSAELNPRNNPYISYFEVPAGSETVSLATLTIDSLRKNVQVVVIGETRGAEAGWLLFVANAMKGVLTTMHGRDARQVVNRMATNAQIAGEPPVSPFAGNKPLAMEAVATAFDFVIHATQLADGRRVINAIHQIAGLSANGEFELIPVFTIDISVSEGIVGGKQLDVRWIRNPEWQWPETLRFALEMARLRRDVGHEDGTTDANTHRLYQQACVAADTGMHETALRLFVEVLRSRTEGYLDAEHRLIGTINAMKRGDTLEKRARIVVAHLSNYVRARQWPELQSALNQLSEWVELRVMVNSIQPLQEYHRRAQAGLNSLKKWYEIRRQIKVWIDQDQLAEAVKSLRTVNLDWFSDDTKQEINALRLKILGRMAARKQTMPEQRLKLCYEMFGLVDAESDILGKLVKAIVSLEMQVGYQDGLDAKDRRFLVGMMSMDNKDFEQARIIFSELGNYRNADLFLKSLRVMEKTEAPNAN